MQRREECVKIKGDIVEGLSEDKVNRRLLFTKEICERVARGREVKRRGTSSNKYKRLQEMHERLMVTVDFSLPQFILSNETENRIPSEQVLNDRDTVRQAAGQQC